MDDSSIQVLINILQVVLILGKDAANVLSHALCLVVAEFANEVSHRNLPKLVRDLFHIERKDFFNQEFYLRLFIFTSHTVECLDSIRMEHV
jgi:hypothetical protein